MATLTSTSTTFDARLGTYITTTVAQDINAQPVPTDSTAFEITTSQSDGVYTTSWKTEQGTNPTGFPLLPSTSTYNYEVHTSVSTEPLVTHTYFTTGGKWALSSADLQSIKIAESDPGNSVTGWIALSTLSSFSANLKIYAGLVAAGQDSYLNPSITLSITDDESSLPSIAAIGQIATGLTNAPTLPSGGNWLFTGMNATALSNGKWRISREYRASGQKGWNTSIYS